MYRFNKNFISLISSIPLMRYILKFFYLWAIRKIRKLALQIPEVNDVLLVSNLDHKNFVYGSSDLNLVFIINNSEHPKKILSEIREALKNLWPANTVINTDNLPCLKKQEIETPLIRSFLMRKNFGDKVSWRSILTKKEYDFNLKAQDHYSIQYQYMKNIERLLFNPFYSVPQTKHKIRSHVKNLYISIKGFQKYNLVKVPKSLTWVKLSRKLMSYTFFSKNKYHKFQILSLNLLDNMQPVTKKTNNSLEGLPQDLLEKLSLINDRNYVYDILLTPALIQLHNKEINGRLFIDIIIHTKKSISYEQHETLTQYILEIKKKSKQNNLKLIFNISSFELMSLKNNFSLGDFPLRGAYRNQQTQSYNSYKYQFISTKKQIEKASIHYLLVQFMDFRSKEQQEMLLGSKFIKSLNIIYQYKLLLEYLEGHEFALSHNYKSIMDGLTVQLSHLSAQSPITEDDWVIIRAQMLFLLKQIRNQLSKKYSSLQNLQF